MFDPEFYPTPREVIAKMLFPFTTRAKLRAKGLDHETRYYSKIDGINDDLIILEPSAGSGVILDYIIENSDRSLSKNIYCCEQDPELKGILQSKDYKVISDNFFEVSGEMMFDLILMNPPFSNGDEHLLHAWNILDRGDIVCLLNEETVKNPYTERRKLLLKIIEKHGSIEYLGNCFSNAERKTNVNVAIVRLKKEAKETLVDFTFNYERSKQDFYLDEETVHNQIALMDVTENMIIQFEQLKKTFVKFLAVIEELDFYSQEIKSEHFNTSEFAMKLAKQSNSKRLKYNDFHLHIQGMMWAKVLGKLGIDKYLTSEVRRNFNQFLKAQQSMKFSKSNMMKIIEMIFMNRNEIMERCITESFDYLTSYDKQNQLHVEGWVTNTKYKVSRKLILPNMIYWGNSYDTASYLKSYGTKFKIKHRFEYSDHTNINDVEKALSYIMGIEYNGIEPVISVLEKRFDQIGQIKTGDSFDNSEIDSTFFTIKFFKKGTVHLYFKNEKVWDEFNMRACLKKNWLPDEEAKEYRKRKRNEEKEGKPVYRQSEKETLLLELF